MKDQKRIKRIRFVGVLLGILGIAILLAFFDVHSGGLLYAVVGSPSYASTEGQAEEWGYVSTLCFTCPVEVALEVESEESDLDLLRRFRDEVMTQTPMGRRYIHLYYKHSPEIVKMLLLDSDLRSRTREMLEKYIPVIRELLDEGAGEEVVLTEEMVQEIEALLSDFAQRAGAELRALIEETKGQLKGFEGKSLKEIQLHISTEAPAPMEKPILAVD